MEYVVQEKFISCRMKPGIVDFENIVIIEKVFQQKSRPEGKHLHTQLLVEGWQR